MMKKVKKLMALVLSLTLVLSLSVFAPVSADESEVALEKLTISSITNNKSWYHNGSSTASGTTDGSPLFDDSYGTWVQWDASTSTGGATLTIKLADVSKVKKIDIYVGATTSWNANRGNSKYSKVPVTATPLNVSSAENWGLASTATEEQSLNEDGTLDNPVIAKTQIAATNTEADLDVISIDLDGVWCDSLSFVLAAAGGKWENDAWTDKSNTTRMAVAEIVVYGDDDILRDENGAICTVQSSKRANKLYLEEAMIDDDKEDSRWRVTGVSSGGTPVELIFRLDGVYDISAFKASEYWQSKNQNDIGSPFKDVDLYIGNTTGAVTAWNQIADGLVFNAGTSGGESVDNLIFGSETVKGDSFKMVINGYDYDVANLENVSHYYLLTDVALYGVKTDDELAGTTMRKCEISSNDGTTDYSYVATTASLVTLAPTFSGTAPSTVVGAAYNADGKLIGVALGDTSSAIVIDIAEGETISYVKILGWESTASLSPVSTTFTRYAVTP